MHPRVELLVILAREKIATVLGDQFEAISLQIRTCHGGDVFEEDQH